MNKICAICAVDPESHSYKKIKETDNSTTYYAKPSSAKLYNDTEGNLAHIDNMMKLNNKPWIFIIDGEGFDIRHASEFATGSGLLDLLIHKYGYNLIEIKFINLSWHIRSVIKLAPAFLDKNFCNKIKIVDDRKYSVLEFI